MTEKYTCPRRIAEGRHYGDSPLRGDGPDQDEWRDDKTCSYDGSLHPDVFMEYVKKEGMVGTTDKAYKFYMPDYEGEVAGVAKFYTHHLSEEQGWEFWKLWKSKKVHWGQFPPYVPIFLPGPSTKGPSAQVAEKKDD